ncbi:hypothetical protein NM688_g450 [Phlebia brevispora]|uniref:Uncharacterized protein n=1 Tax=Phlebia brevispora TaxID=194682 RepID=A0ACC1TEF5_9APHY|nr:hypothetical protein NM688_g450 [Phlebia brevispora]
MSTEEEEVSPYELLGVGVESTEAEIKTAYRQRSLKVHPDRNRGNPDAARKFHGLNQAYELLLDPLRRMALDAKIRIQEARKTRFAQYDTKRKNLVEELEERERAFKKARLDKDQKQKQVWRENERIMEEGRILREQREKERIRREAEITRAQDRERSELEPPSLGSLDTTVRLKFTLAACPTLTSPESIGALLSQFGPTEASEIVISLKPAPPKKAKRGTALVPFKQIGDAFASVCASGREKCGLKDVEISWAGGKEPELIGWLKKMGKLGGPNAPSRTASPAPVSASVPRNQPSSSPAQAKPPSGSTPFSTFPSSFPDLPDTAPSIAATTTVPGLDYESLTLMRLRQAERERLEREIREREAQEE